MCHALRELFADEPEERENRGIERGREAGKAEAVFEILEETGPVSAQLRDGILSQTGGKLLAAWLKLAARMEPAEAFKEAAGI